MLAVLLATAMPGLARAQDCGKAADQATLDQCAGKSLAVADATLNKLYRQVEQRLTDDPARTKLLVAAQRAWVGFRDAECGFDASGVAGGSIYPMVYALCAEKLTRKRIGDFKADLACQEGDTSCPVPPS